MLQSPADALQQPSPAVVPMQDSPWGAAQPSQQQQQQQQQADGQRAPSSGGLRLSAGRGSASPMAFSLAAALRHSLSEEQLGSPMVESPAAVAAQQARTPHAPASARLLSGGGPPSSAPSSAAAMPAACDSQGQPICSLPTPACIREWTDDDSVAGTPAAAAARGELLANVLVCPPCTYHSAACAAFAVLANALPQKAGIPLTLGPCPPGGTPAGITQTPPAVRLAMAAVGAPTQFTPPQQQQEQQEQQQQHLGAAARQPTPAADVHGWPNDAAAAAAAPPSAGEPGELAISDSETDDDLTPPPPRQQLCSPQPQHPQHPRQARQQQQLQQQQQPVAPPPPTAPRRKGLLLISSSAAAGGKPRAVSRPAEQEVSSRPPAAPSPPAAATAQLSAESSPAAELPDDEPMPSPGGDAWEPAQRTMSGSGDSSPAGSPVEAPGAPAASSSQQHPAASTSGVLPGTGQHHQHQRQHQRLQQGAARSQTQGTRAAGPRDWSEDDISSSGSDGDFPTPKGAPGTMGCMAVQTCDWRWVGCGRRQRRLPAWAAGESTALKRRLPAAKLPHHLLCSPAFAPTFPGAAGPRRRAPGGLTGLTQLDPAAIVIARPKAPGGACRCAGGAGRTLPGMEWPLVSADAVAPAEQHPSPHARTVGRGGAGGSPLGGVVGLKLLQRPPRGNAVRQHHCLPSLKGVQFAEQVGGWAALGGTLLGQHLGSTACSASGCGC